MALCHAMNRLWPKWTDRVLGAVQGVSRLMHTQVPVQQSRGHTVQCFQMLPQPSD